MKIENEQLKNVNKAYEVWTYNYSRTNGKLDYYDSRGVYTNEQEAIKVARENLDLFPLVKVVKFQRRFTVLGRFEETEITSGDFIAEEKPFTNKKKVRVI